MCALFSKLNILLNISLYQNIVGKKHSSHRIYRSDESSCDS